MPEQRQKLLQKLIELDSKLDAAEAETKIYGMERYLRVCKDFDRTALLVLDDLIAELTEGGDLDKILKLCAKHVPGV